MFICENHQALILISKKLEAKSLDQMPQLLQDKAMMEGSSSQADISLGNPVGYKVQLYNRTSFLMEEEEAIVVTPQKQENQAVPKKASRELYNSSSEEAAPTAPKDLQHAFAIVFPGFSCNPNKNVNNEDAGD
nr:hypothetical protein CFP56_23739 [Quercus suber]